MAEARNLLGSLHLLCFSLTHLSIWKWEGGERDGEEGGGVSYLPLFSPLVDVSPSSHPSLTTQCSYIFVGNPALCLNSPPPFSFSLVRRSRGRGEEGRREGQMRMSGNQMNNRREMSFTSLQPCVGCVSPAPWPQGPSAELHLQRGIFL